MIALFNNTKLAGHIFIFVAFALAFISPAHAAITCNYISGGTYTTPTPAFTTNIAVNWEKVSWASDIAINPTATCADIGGTCSNPTCAGVPGGANVIVSGATGCKPPSATCCVSIVTIGLPSVQMALSTDKGSTWSSFLSTSPSALSLSSSSSVSFRAKLITPSALVSPRLTSVTLYSGPRLAASQGNTVGKCWPTSVVYTCTGPFASQYYNDVGTLSNAGATKLCDSVKGGPNATLVQARLTATDYTEDNYTDNVGNVTNPLVCSGP